MSTGLAKAPLQQELLQFRILGVGLACSALIIALSYVDVPLQWISILTFLILAGAVGASLPIEHALFAYLGYLTIEGMLKVLSNYHPIVHVGQDLILMALVSRCAFDFSNGGIRKLTNTPCFILFVTFLVWIFLQYANPYGLGLLPSIAGTKVYVSMIFYFFLVYHYVPRHRLPALFAWFVGLATVEAMIASMEYLYGQDWAFGLHPRYRQIAADKFVGIFFRPFGTTALPGAPSIYISLAAPMAAYLCMSDRTGFKLKIFGLCFFLIAIPALVFCQVRTALLFTVFSALSVALAPGPDFGRRFKRLGLFLVLGSAIAYPQLDQLIEESAEPTAFNSALIADAQETFTEKQLDQLRDRTLSLTDPKAISGARSGAVSRALALADRTLLGIGLSRVGAASAVWSERIKQNPYFGSTWSFTDNLYLTIFTETGLFGLLFWLILIASIVTVIRNRIRVQPQGDRLLVWSCLTAVVLLLVGGFGTEGILYAPTSTLFWLYLSVGLKEANG